MVQVLRPFIKAERTGNWPLRLQSIQAMLPFLAASGHNLYTKTAYVYLMPLQSLDEDHPDVYASFINRNHVIRRSNRYWAGISSNLFIEQVLMRSVKTAGGLTRGRGMTESQRSLWLMSMPSCAEINQAMQDLSGVGYFSSEQHKDETRARQKKDTDDIQTLLTFLKSRNPFIEPEVDRSLRNIETGVVADKTVNVDDAKVWDLHYTRTIPTTKDVTHIRRTKRIISPKVNFNNETPINTKKDEFLLNSENKQYFINTLGEKLKDGHVQVTHAEDDVDLMIVFTAIEKSEQHTTTVIGEDTDLLILLCYHSQDTINKIYFKLESKQNTHKIKIWDIIETRKKLVCNILPFIHAFSGCDTTSRIFGQDKGPIFKAGEHIFVALYGGLQDVETLDMLRYRIFALKLHCLRVYYQTQVWIGKGDKLDPKDWGWHVEDNKLLPIRAILPPAPEKLLRIVRCNCKLNCDTKRCSCRKHGIDCSPACGECRGMNCSNTSNITEADELDDMLRHQYACILQRHLTIRRLISKLSV
ncbi:unnamed protein product [Mytilus coruscus]|uniref:Tesmin/TSO1-like CXC domain-containing protein n=1 Tax=Mytilus coruscus TaxID=42192 RepID=A0A6J8EL04_MYTCO|nr:unnamed protein product [Mytilus coruscus]